MIKNKNIPPRSFGNENSYAGYFIRKGITGNLLSFMENKLMQIQSGKKNVHLF